MFTEKDRIKTRDEGFKYLFKFVNLPLLAYKEDPEVVDTLYGLWSNFLQGPDKLTIDDIKLITKETYKGSQETRKIGDFLIESMEKNHMRILNDQLNGIFAIHEVKYTQSNSCFLPAGEAKEQIHFAAIHAIFNSPIIKGQLSEKIYDEALQGENKQLRKIKDLKFKYPLNERHIHTSIVFGYELAIEALKFNKEVFVEHGGDETLLKRRCAEWFRMTQVRLDQYDIILNRLAKVE